MDNNPLCLANKTNNPCSSVELLPCFSRLPKELYDARIRYYKGKYVNQIRPDNVLYTIPRIHEQKLSNSFYYIVDFKGFNC